MPEDYKPNQDFQNSMIVQKLNPISIPITSTYIWTDILRVELIESKIPKSSYPFKLPN